MPSLFDDHADDPEEPGNDTPTRVCPHCSTQSRTAGQFCPHCGKSLVRKASMSPKRKRVLVGLSLLLLLAAAGTGVGLKLKHDSDARAERERVARIAEEQRREEARERRAEERRQEAEEEAQAALEEIELDGRKELEKGLRKSITEDAEEKVSLGVLEGPILRTVCDPVGGGRDDLEARTGKYECLAVNEESADGTYSGWEYSGTINYDKYSWSWELGDG